jgi:hypothetical protein
VDPGEMGAILETGGVEGPGRQAGERTDSWTVEEDRRYKISVSTGDGLVTTPSHVYAQSMYHMYIVCQFIALTTITGTVFYCI